MVNIIPLDLIGNRLNNLSLKFIMRYKRGPLLLSLGLCLEFCLLFKNCLSQLRDTPYVKCGTVCSQEGKNNAKPPF